MALRVLLVDDEMMILKGLEVLIDWEAEGCTVVGTASTGKQALQMLEEMEIDLVICDIKMPEMTGLELLQKVYEEKLSDASFVIMSGYSDFQYARTAIHYHCLEYILKPVQQSELLEIIRRVNHKKDQDTLEELRNLQMIRTCLAQYLGAVFRGKAGEKQLSFISKHLKLSRENYYIHISMDGLEILEEMSDEEISNKKEMMFSNLKTFLGDDIDHCIPDTSEYEEEYEIGFIFSDYMLNGEKQYPGRREYLQALRSAAEKELNVPVVLLVGKCASDITSLAYSYSSACTLRSFKGFQAQKEIYFYEEDVQVRQRSAKLNICKEAADALVEAVRLNDTKEIENRVELLFREMEENQMEERMISMNIDYMLFQLIHLAVEIDGSVEQNMVLQYISDRSSHNGITRGSKKHLHEFCCAYAEYLSQLRKKSTKGILGDIIREVQEHYAENLTLRELGQKYFVNSSYLGQIFRNKYGQSFKDYLNSYRIGAAAKILLDTDKRVLDISEEVGYQDV
ncbi:MAG: response regulator, partial [Lachnospiraceae bacterium]|nr:response regulator [Lachnospiraceae bacterium]